MNETWTDPHLALRFRDCSRREGRKTIRDVSWGESGLNQSVSFGRYGSEKTYPEGCGKREAPRDEVSLPNRLRCPGLSLASWTEIPRPAG